MIDSASWCREEQLTKKRVLMLVNQAAIELKQYELDLGIHVRIRDTAGKEKAIIERHIYMYIYRYWK